jgi:hypothetical protein
MMKVLSEKEFIRGVVAGSISAVVICLFFEVLEQLGLARHCWLFMAGQAIMEFKHTFWQSAFAFPIHLGVGAFWGIFIAFLFSKIFTKRYYILKSLLIGLAIFFLHIGLLSKALHYPAKMREDILSVFFILLSYLIYAVLTVVIIMKLSKQESDLKD